MTSKNTLQSAVLQRLLMERKGYVPFMNNNGQTAMEEHQMKTSPSTLSQTPSTTSRKMWQVDVECNKCHDKIYSKYSGEFVRCKCGAIAVDQTPHYARYIGNREDFKDNEQIGTN